MKLPHPFYLLPIRLDVQRLQQEVNSIPEAAWQAHPTGFKGNSSIRLISANGQENDDMVGKMEMTPWLEKLPYIRQILATLGLTWSRSRLMRLAPGAIVPRHSDVSYHWRNRMRFHMPVITAPEVQFECNGDTVHMESGSVWTFDNWLPHSVKNESNITRIHLVADSVGNAKLWQSLKSCNYTPGGDTKHFQPLAWQSNTAMAALKTELSEPHEVMHASEVELLIKEYLEDLPLDTANPHTNEINQQWQQVLTNLNADWRELWAMYGNSKSGWGYYSQLRDKTLYELRQIKGEAFLKSNQIEAFKAIKSGLISYLVPAVPSSSNKPADAAKGNNPLLSLRLPKPVFIVACPRSGSTLLFETLSKSPELWTLGGEAHWLIEQFPDWQPETGKVDSNRLDASTLTAKRAQEIFHSVAAKMRSFDGQPLQGHANVRWLEKTPKNALRIPLLKALFPDALFIFLWRDPRENISSIIQAWKRGGWVTYKNLPGRTEPWSLLLPPGWQEMNNKPLHEIAAFQWNQTNKIILNDLNQLPQSDWISINYTDLCSSPEKTIKAITAFAGLAMTQPLIEHCSKPLPLSKYTESVPEKNKWHRHEAEIESILDYVSSTWETLIGMDS